MLARNRVSYMIYELTHEGYYWGFAIMVLIIAICSQAILLIVISMSRYALVGMDILDMIHMSTGFLRCWR